MFIRRLVMVVRKFLVSGSYSRYSRYSIAGAGVLVTAGTVDLLSTPELGEPTSAIETPLFSELEHIQDLENSLHYDEAFERLLALEKGIAELPESDQAVVYLKLAIHHSLGRGSTPQDTDKGLEYYHKAAPLLLQYNATSLHNYHLGLLFQTGICLDVDYGKSIEYFMLALEDQNSIYAYNAEYALIQLSEYVSEVEESVLWRLEKNHERGDLLFLIGIIKNDWNAIQSSAELGYPLALFHCGRMLELQQQYVLAIDYFRRAADMGLSCALNKMGEINEGNDYELSRSYYQRALAADDIDFALAANNLACLYYNGYALAPGSSSPEDPENKRAAIAIWKEAAKLDEDVFYIYRNLARAYHEGKYIEQDLEKACELYERATAKGDEEAWPMYSQAAKEALYQSVRSLIE